jgi:hypothetical protein
LFTLFVYATLPVGPQVWRWFSSSSAFWSNNAGVAGLVVVGAGAVWIAARRTDLPPRSWAVGIVIALTYAVCLRFVNLTPAEKTHFLYYGFLGFLVHHAMRQHQQGGALYAGVVALVTIIGLGDELIQYALPGRFFEWKDVGLNALSGALATAIVVQLERPAASVQK